MKTTDQTPLPLLFAQQREKQRHTIPSYVRVSPGLGKIVYLLFSFLLYFQVLHTRSTGHEANNIYR